MRTCTTMIYTDGTTSRYGVFRGKMIDRAFDLHRAELIATYDLTGEEKTRVYFDGRYEFYRETTARHATKDAPAVYWQA